VTARTSRPLATSQDHKRLLDGDQGPTPAAWAPIPGAGGDARGACARHARDHPADHPGMEKMAFLHRLSVPGLMIDATAK